MMAFLMEQAPDVAHRLSLARLCSLEGALDGRQIGGDSSNNEVGAAKVPGVARFVVSNIA
jgi:hypothetical protein